MPLDRAVAVRPDEPGPGSKVLGHAPQPNVKGWSATCRRPPARAAQESRSSLRRDFNTTDSEQAGLHFVALQRSIADFEATRREMNAADAPFTNPGITATVNNGIKEFLFVLRRANYAVPARADLSFPVLPEQREALL